MRLILPVLLFFIFSTDNLCTSIILPLFPKIAEQLHVYSGEMHESLGFITLGLFFSLLIIGLKINKLGLRNALILLFIILGLGSLISSMASNIYLFFLGEFLQGLGIGAASPIIKALVNHFLKNSEGKIFSYLGSWPNFIYFLGPIIGSQFYNDWNDVFYIILFLALFMLLMSYFIPIKLNKNDRGRSFQQTILILFKNKDYIICSLIRSFAYVGFFIFLGWAPFLFISDLHFSHSQFSYLMIFPTLGLILGQISSVLIENSHRKALYISGFACLSSGLFLIILFCFGQFNAWTILFAATVFFMAFGLLLVQVSLAIFSIIDDNISATAMIICDLMVYLIVSIMIFLLAKLVLDAGLILGMVFAMCGIFIVLMNAMLKFPSNNARP